MGLEIKRNKKGEYKLTCGISGQKYFDGKYGSEDDVKQVLIEKQIWKFLEEVIKIETDFPNQYHINDRYEMVKDHKMFLEIWLEKSREGDGALEEFIFTNFKSIIDKYKLHDFFECLK
jgi:hypothetical protein